MTTTKEKERAKDKESKETTKEKGKDTTKEEKDTIKDGIHGAKEDTTATTTKDKEEEKEKEERRILHLCSVISTKRLVMQQPTAGTRTLPTLQQLLVQGLLVRHNTTAWTTLRMINRLHSCLEIKYLSTTNMASASQAVTCKLLLHQEQPPQALHRTSLLQDQYYMTSAMFIVEKLNTLEINYKQQLTNGMNHEYARELPAYYLKHWGLLVATGAYVSVAPKHFALCTGGTTYS